MMQLDEAKRIVEALLLVTEDPLDKDQIATLLKNDDEEMSSYIPLVNEVLDSITKECSGKGYELVEVSSGFRFQIRDEMSDWAAKLWLHKPRRFSRALLETLALIAYRQPITRGEIEDVRGIRVSTHTIRTLLDRQWVRELGTKETPGRPVTYGTTHAFLDYFNLRSLDDLPPLSEITQLGSDAVEMPNDTSIDTTNVIEVSDFTGESEHAFSDETDESSVYVEPENRPQE